MHKGRIEFEIVRKLEDVPDETVSIRPIRDRTHARISGALVQLVYTGLDGTSGVKGGCAIQVGGGVIEDRGEEGVGVEETCSLCVRVRSSAKGIQ